jgi:hypothetical protein
VSDAFDVAPNPLIFDLKVRPQHCQANWACALDLSLKSNAKAQ